MVSSDKYLVFCTKNLSNMVSCIYVVSIYLSIISGVFRFIECSSQKSVWVSEFVSFGHTQQHCMQQYKISRAFDTRNCFNGKKNDKKRKRKRKERRKKKKNGNKGEPLSRRRRQVERIQIALNESASSFNKSLFTWVDLKKLFCWKLNNRFDDIILVNYVSKKQSLFSIN